MEWKDASEMHQTADMQAVAREMAERMPRKNPVLPYKGEGGILSRYLSSSMIDGGRGDLSLLKGIKSFGTDVWESVDHLGVEHTETGVYTKLGATTSTLFVNLGSGAVIFEGLPDNDGPVKINYYGDTIGFRDLDITPFPIAAEILRDLNEAFKMMQKYAEK
jgi:hypothetical protein